MDFWAFLRGGVVSLHLLLLPLESHINLTLQMFDSLVYMNIQSPLFVPNCFVCLFPLELWLEIFLLDKSQGRVKTVFENTHLSKMSTNWSQSLFGCTNDLETCKFSKLQVHTPNRLFMCVGCCGAVCGPCLMCRNAGYLDKSGFLCCFLGVLLPCIPFFLLRGAAREKYNIEVRTYFVPTT